MFFGGIVVAVLTPTAFAGASRKWWRFVVLVSVVAFAANLAVSLSEASKPANNILTRDVVAWVILAGGSPLLVAAASRSVAIRTDGVWFRTGAAVLTLVVLAWATPLVMLLVHCTSGDCL